MLIEPIVLEGKYVRLEPLRPHHLAALAEIGLEETIWRLSPTIIRNEQDLELYVRSALADQELGTAIPFATIARSYGTLVGSTRFGNIDPVNRKAEIGWTWITPKFQRTAINTEAKLLMLAHAFETWKCIRVELKTDSLNEQSRKAIARIGGVEEGILRNHMITETGRYRHSVYFSILESEWSAVKENLEAMLAEER